MSRPSLAGHTTAPIVVALATLLPQFALAADNGIYVGASFTAPEFDRPRPDYQLTDENDGYKLIVGARPLDWLAVEANLSDFGETTTELTVANASGSGAGLGWTRTVDTRVLSVSALALWAQGPLDFYARAGTARWQQDDEQWPETTRAEGTDLTYGVGIQGRLGSFGLRLEYENLDVANEGAELWSVGFTYTFF
jgi:hypothetical protein